VGCRYTCNAQGAEGYDCRSRCQPRCLSNWGCLAGTGSGSDARLAQGCLVIMIRLIESASSLHRGHAYLETM
jgi:hypothetical protein